MYIIYILKNRKVKKPAFHFPSDDYIVGRVHNRHKKESINRTNFEKGHVGRL